MLTRVKLNHLRRWNYEKKGADAPLIRKWLRCRIWARRSSNSTSARCVPRRLLIKGEMAARRKSANPAVPRLGGRDVSRNLRRERDGGKPEQHSKQEPKIGIKQEIFVRLHAAKGGRKKQE